jgi:hypothetical protein
MISFGLNRLTPRWEPKFVEHRRNHGPEGELWEHVPLRCSGQRLEIS